MNVRELIDILEEMPEDAEVRLAEQPSWPFEYSINDVVLVDGHGTFCPECDVDWTSHEAEGCGESEPTGDDDEVLVYISEGTQLRHLPGIASQELGWR